MQEPLTKRQRSILDYIREYIEGKGFSPSIREICMAFGIASTRGAHRHLETLEAKGYIRRESTARSIKIVEEFASSQKVVNLPLIGTVAAGTPILAAENVEDVIPVAWDVVKNIRDGFLLRVRGDSMVGDGIYDGDLIIVKPQPDAVNGEIVVAMIEDEATVKRFYREQGFIRLQPSNLRFDPIIVSRDFKVVGKVIGLIRKFR